ncbi:MAG: PKD domain-containing protein, partial [Bacteroidia bacterium]
SNAAGNTLPIVMGSPVAGIVAGWQTIVTAGTDPYGLFPMVYAGTYSAKLGDTRAFYQEENISQTFTVSAANTNFTYAYAVVLQDGGHAPIDQPFFDVDMKDQAGAEITCANYFVAASAGITGWQTSTLDNTVHFKTWTLVNIDLTPYIGQNVTIKFTAAGCDQGGHFGYAYVDCNCSPLTIMQPDSLCPGGSVSLSAPAGAASYSWAPGGQTSQNITVTTPGTYSVTITSPQGCTEVLTDKVVQYPAPVANFTYTIPSCVTADFTNTSTVANPYVISGYSWNFGDGGTSTTTNPTHTYGASGTYNVKLIVTSSSGCRDSITLPVVVVTTSVTAVASPATICTGGSSTLTASGTTTYSWSTGATTASITVTPATTTTYTVTGTSTGCTTTASVTVTVTPPPTITVNSPTICVGTNVILTPGGAVTYSWSTGATTNFITVNPAVTTSYTVTGTSSAGCTGSAIATVTVNPLPTVTVNSASICPTSSAILTGGGASTYSWSTGASTNSITVSPATTTTYTVTGTDVNGCTNTAIATVTVNNSLTVTVNSGNICPGSSMILTSAGAGVGGTYAWTPAGGLSATTGASVTANPATTTSYTVTGTSTSGCTGSAIATVTVYPTPTIGVNSITICSGSSGSLTGTGGVSYSWSPAGGLSATTGTTVTANPTVTTNYTVTGTDVNGCTNTAIATVTVNPLPVVTFTSTTVCFNNATAFTDGSTTGVGTITSWSWNFGEPSSGANNVSLTQNPTHTYGSSGTFNVRLIVTSSGGCVDSITLPVVVNPLPVAGFTSLSVCAGSAMNFTDISTIPSGSITAWAWNFGDPGSGVNNTSTTQSPSHVYSTAGNYTVTLTVTSNNGCQGTTTKTVTVNPIPVASFTSTSVCVSDATTFTDGSTVAPGTITSWSWNFGDGGTASTQNTTHTYATSGTFTVTLTVTSNGGCTNTVTNTITVFPSPTALFTATNVCLNNTSTFTDASTVSIGTITGWSWNFGDGNTSIIQSPTHTYAASGVYVVSLTVTSSNGCSNTISKNVSVYPLPVAAFSNTTVCQNSPTSFTDGSTVSFGIISNWSWNFGDGNTSGVQNPVHLYAKDSTYIVKLVVTSSNGCVDSVTHNVTVNPNPVVAFTVNDSVGCAPLCVDFTDHSTIANGGTINTWLWSYGDGGTDNTQNPNHCYTVPGTYDVMLTVSSQNNCSTTLTHSRMITVYPVPEAAFTMNPQPTTIVNPTINFVDQSTGASSWHWNFGDGDTLTWASDNHPTHTYGDTGTFNVEEIVINQFGCSDTVTHPIIIEPTFTFYAPNAFTPNGDGVNDYFYGTGIGIKTYEMWIFDRWGNLIFYTNDLNNKWNGVVMGGTRMAQIDVYVWKVKLLDVFDKSHQYIGHVSLVK